MTDIFQVTTRPDSKLFFRKNDKFDPRLGEIVLVEPSSYANASVVIVGCPQDEGVRRNNGRAGAANAPAAIREQFYKLTPFNINKRVFDLGDVNLTGTLEETHDVLTSVVAQILRDGKRLIILG